MLSKNQKFLAFTKTNYKGLQQQLEPGKWYESPEAMNFPNDRMQSISKKWDDQSDLALLFSCFVLFICFFSFWPYCYLLIDEKLAK